VNRNTTLAAIALATAGTAGAQAMYRCGNSYGQQPCAGGSEVAAIAPRPSSDMAQARAAAQADARRADAMEKARLAQEKNAPKALIIGPKEAAPAAAPKPQGKKKPGKPEEFTAVAPGTVKHKK